MAYQRTQEIGCPFINRGDDRCGEHFSLCRLNEAFTICLSGYRDCPTYLQLLRESTVEHHITITVDGQAFASRPLRATGS